VTRLSRRGPEARTVYRISPLRTWLPTGFVVALSVLLLVFAASSSAEPDAQRAFTLTGIFTLGCAWVLYLLLRFTRLELSESGIKLCQLGYTLETPWDNVAALYDVPHAEGLVLHRPMQSQGSSVLRAFRNTGAGAGLRFYNVEQVALLTEQRLIPIEAFAYWLRHGRLRDDLMRYAPSIRIRH
jgi:hypothetical protein